MFRPYATGFSAATALAHLISEKGSGARDKYLEFLSMGGSDYPIELLKKAGVDMSSPKPVKEVARIFTETSTKWRSCFSSSGNTGYAVDPISLFCFGSLLYAGPNIIFAMNTARLFGFRKTIPLMTGMTVGLFAVMMLNAVGNLFIGAFIPKVLPWLRGIGSIYLFWLAWKIAFPKNLRHQKGTPGRKKFRV